jgi:LysM repeat protein
MQGEDNMSLELIREVIKANQIIGKNSTQTIVEHDIIVPDVNPDVDSILLIDGDVYINRADTGDGEILVDGEMYYKILYISDGHEGQVKSINLVSGFSSNLNIPGSEQGMRAKVKCNIEHMEYKILHGRKINVKSVLQVRGVVSNQIEKSFVNNFEGIEDIQVLRKKYDINWFLGTSTNTSEIREIVEIPSAKQSIVEILRNDIKITGKDYKVTDDRVIVKGELNISTLYMGEDESNGIQYMEHEIPFTQFIDLQGITDDSYCDVDFNITGSFFEAVEDSDGELRALKCEVYLGISVDGFEKREIEVIEDTYSPLYRLDLEKDVFTIEEPLSECRSQVIIKQILELPSELPEILEVFNVICKPVLSEYKIDEERMILEGIVDNRVLYIAENDKEPILCYEQEFPFRHVIELDRIQSDMSYEIELDVEHSSYSVISSAEVEIRLTVGVDAKGVGQLTIPLISEIGETLLDDKRLESRPSVTIYFTQPGDSLWKIAKKYRATVEDIQRINPETNLEVIKPGKQIIITNRTNN